VNAATGATSIYVAPGADSLAVAWSRLFTPLVQPTDSIPAALGHALPFPPSVLRFAAALLARERGDSVTWIPEPREPYELIAPDSSGRPGAWTAQAFATGSPPQLAALIAGSMTRAGPALRVWTSPTALRLPGELVGSGETSPGVLRLWTAAGSLLTEQALFDPPAAGAAPRAVRQVYLTWGERQGQGPTAATALRNLLTSGAAGRPADTSLVARWEVARRLAAQADSALKAGDLEAFGRLDAELRRLLGTGRKLAPSPERR